MKWSWVLVLGIGLAACVPGRAQNRAPATFQGEIADSSCAMNVHSLSRSHKEMLKNKAFGENAASCARHCVEHFGASYVLVVKQNVYRLDDQLEAAKWAGQAVNVAGDLDEKSKTIHVRGILGK